MINIFTDTVKIVIDFIIRDANNRQSAPFNLFCSDFVTHKSFFFIVLRSVKLYNKTCAVTVEIRYVLVNYFLAQETNRIGTEKVIP